MKTKKNRKNAFSWKYLVIAVGVFLLSVLVACLTRLLLRNVFGMSGDEAGLLTSMLEGIVASIAIAQVLHQMKIGENIEQSQNNIDEARFILEYNKSFIQDTNMTKVESLLEHQMEGNEQADIDSDLRQACINYLVYLEGLAPLVLKGVLNLDHIDDLMAYRFFLAVNSPALQEDQLFKYPDYYLGCFKLYQVWKKYRLSHGKDILQGETSLDRLYIRDALATDNKRRIAELIFETDEYIYKGAFGNAETAQDAFPFCGLFQLSNIKVAIQNGEILGIAVICDGENEAIDPDIHMTEHKELTDSFSKVCKEYFNTIQDYNKNHVYIACLSVDESHRKEGIGSALLNYIFAKHPGASFTLDVLKNNSAKSLYEGMGFTEVSTHAGFSLNEQKPMVNTMKKTAAD